MKAKFGWGEADLVDKLGSVMAAHARKLEVVESPVWAVAEVLHLPEMLAEEAMKVLELETLVKMAVVSASVMVAILKEQAMDMPLRVMVGRFRFLVVAGKRDLVKVGWALE